MKKIIFGSTLVCAMVLGVFSCSKDFLDTKPTASNNNVSLANDKGVNALLIGAYHGFVGGGLQQNGWFGNMGMVCFRYQLGMGCRSMLMMQQKDQISLTRVPSFRWRTLQLTLPMVM